MIALVAFCVILGLSAGFHIGWYGKQLHETLKRLKPAENAPEPYVTVGSAAKPYAHPNTVGSQVVTPLPPSVIKAREDEELRRFRRGA